MGALKGAMDFFGLAEPNAEELDNYEAEAAASSTPTESVRSPKPASSSAGVLSSRTKINPLKREGASVTQFPRSVSPAPSGDRQRIVTVTPSTYNQAKEIGEAFREGIPVIMNLSRMNDREAHRMVDFAAGLIFGLEGTIEKIDGRVFLLSPKTVEVAERITDTSQVKNLFE